MCKAIGLDLGCLGDRSICHHIRSCLPHGERPGIVCQHGPQAHSVYREACSLIGRLASSVQVDSPFSHRCVRCSRITRSQLAWGAFRSRPIVFGAPAIRGLWWRTVSSNEFGGISRNYASGRWRYRLAKLFVSKLKTTHLKMNSRKE